MWSFELTGPHLNLVLPLAAVLVIRGILGAAEDVAALVRWCLRRRASR